MSRADEARVAKDIGSALGIRFEAGNLILGKWGMSDCYATLGQHSYLVLEVETSQKHPTTNVAKLWPYLEEKPETRIFLIHAYFQASPGHKSNRGEIATWLGRKMEKGLGERFQYFPIVVDRPERDKENQRLREAVENFRKV